MPGRIPGPQPEINGRFRFYLAHRSTQAEDDRYDLWPAPVQENGSREFRTSDSIELSGVSVTSEVAVRMSNERTIHRHPPLRVAGYTEPRDRHACIYHTCMTITK